MISTDVKSQWELICGRASYSNLAQSTYFFGLMSGSWVFGALADIYGRKKILFLSLVGCVVAGLGYGLASGFLVFAVFRFIYGALHQAQAVAGYSLLLELVGTSKRSFVATASQTFLPIGMCTLALLAYLIRDWRTLVVFNSLIGLGFIPLWR